MLPQHPTLPKIAPMSNPAIPKLIAAPFSCIGGAVHESKAIPTAAGIVIRRTLRVETSRNRFKSGRKAKPNELPEGHLARLAAESGQQLICVERLKAIPP